MSLPGNIVLNAVEVPLLVRSAFHVNLTDLDGAAVDLDSATVTAYLLKNPDDALADAVKTLVSTDPTQILVLTPTSSGRILCTIADPSTLSANRLYTLVVKVVDDGSSAVLHVQTFNAVPMLVAPSQSFDLGDSTPAATLSVNYINVRTFTSLAGLSALTTVGQTVGCIVKFFVSGEPQEWLLTAGTTATDGVSWQRPDDYAASTNEKVWKRIA